MLHHIGLYVTKTGTSGTAPSRGGETSSHKHFRSLDDGSKKLIKISKQRIVNSDTKFRKKNESTSLVDGYWWPLTSILVYSGKLILAPGSYAILVATHQPGLLAPFNLSVLSTSESNFHLEPIKDTSTSFVNYCWAHESAGGCMSYPTWVKNPKFHLNVSSTSTVTLTLERRTQKILSKTNSKKSVLKEEPPFIGFYLFKADRTNYFPLLFLSP